MDMKERFNKAFAYLRGEQVIKGQKDFAEKLGATPSNISKALSGDKSALTNNLMKRFSAAFPGVFNLRWLILGEGDMLQGSQKPQEEVKNREVDNSSNEIINRLVDELSKQLSKKDKQIEDLSVTIKSLKDELSQLRKELKGTVVPSQKTEMESV